MTATSSPSPSITWSQRDSLWRLGLEQSTARRFLWTTALVALLGGLVTAWLPQPEGMADLRLSVAAQWLLAALSGAVLWWLRDGRTLGFERLMRLATWAATAVSFIVAAAEGRGILSLTLGFVPLIVCVLGLLLGVRSACLLAAAAMLAVLLLAQAHLGGWLMPLPAPAAATLLHTLATHVLLLAGALSAGVVIPRLAWPAYASVRDRDTRFRALLSIAADQYWELDAQLCLVRSDDAQTLAPCASLLGEPGLRLGPLLTRQAVDAAAGAAAQRALAEGQAFHRLLLRLPGAGEARFIELSGQPKHDATGRLLGYWGVVQDVSRRARQDDHNRWAHQLLQAAFDAAPDCMALVERDSGRLLMVNQRLLDTFGRRRDEVLGRSTLALQFWDDPAERERMLALLARDGQVDGLRSTGRTATGRRFSVRLSVRPFEAQGLPMLVVYGRDTSQAERTQLEHQAALQRASVGIAFTSDGRVTVMNPCFERLLGWQAGEGLGRPLAEALQVADAGQHAALQQLLQGPVARQHHGQLTLELLRRDGSRVWCRLQVDPLHPAPAADDGALVWTAEDITAEHRAQAVLQAARDAADRASRDKSRLLASASHEIRTPLAGLLGLARLAQRAGLPEARRLQHLAGIQGSAERLLALLDDMLDHARIEAGALRLRPATFDLREALHTAMRDQHGPAEARGLALSLQWPEGLSPWVEGDAQRLRQVVGNYLANAIRHTDAGPIAIEVQRSPDGGPVEIAVRDSGIGIEPAALARLFQPFVQAGRRPGGTGLGLAICRELAQLMGGEVGCSSQPGLGSRFWLRLPLPERPAPAGPRERARPGLAPSPPAIPPASPTPNQAATPVPNQAATPATIPVPSPAPGPLHGRRILVADDDPVNLLVSRLLVEDWGAQVLAATSGAEALALALAAQADGHPVDAVLMDLQMPDGDGLQTCRRLHARLGAAAPPVLGLTADDLGARAAEARDAGMRQLLRKPSSAAELLAALQAVLPAAR